MSETPPAAAAPAASQPTPLDVSGSDAGLLNKLRAAVLGANDGIVSIAGMVMGVAGATTDSVSILVAGIAGLVAGALSMAVGEYVSVSAQRDSERALLAREGRPAQQLISAWAAAGASMAAFTAGALVPLLAMVLTPPAFRVAATVAAVVVALSLTGYLSARAGRAPAGVAVARVITGGLLAMAITYGIGALVGTQLG
ncbi:VIT1/CCC1 transporter family protein [Propioniciclava soli]|uniref:VIT1/CCC1 transporter family protein n=2 Tax=Propioniciclava soli TaxID=2775081 RepID=A0ABZ3C5P3_9ACTN|nr:VIT1/CCC1 transporter family protein [Propioniciclava soli]